MTVPKTTETPVVEPFSVDVFIGDTGARSVAGPDANRIKGDIRNIIQLIVMDDTGNIAAFDEVRRESDAQTEAELWIDSLPFGKSYHFLLLMGHWERNYAAESTGGPYEYTAAPPTLLAAGLKEQVVTGSGKVTVTMWPVVVDTVFTSLAGTIGPEVIAGKPGEVSLLPVNWDVKWTVQYGLSDLVKAQKVPDSGAGEALLLKSAQTLVGTGTDTWNGATLNGNIITRSIETYTSGFGKIGTSGFVNFKLEYIPYNLNGSGGTNPWTALDASSVFDLSGTREPVWIIRNGVNDLAQDVNTDFTLFHKKGGPGIGTANGNGGVRFGVAAKTPGGPDGSTLVVKDGVFVGPAGSTMPDIRFTTSGYNGDAEGYYAVVSAGPPVPGYSAYIGSLGPLTPGTHTEQISLPGTSNYDVYVIIFKDGAVSAPLKINTGSGSVIINPVWGEDPYLSLYVKSDGLDTNAGNRDNPLATVQEALERLEAAYTPAWPGYGEIDVSPAAIIVMDTVTVPKRIDIFAEYPPIILCDDPELPGGTLRPVDSNFELPGTYSGNPTLVLVYNGKATLAGELTLAGGAGLAGSPGVSLDYGVFTMKGGEIFGFGSGVYAQNSAAFTMNAGKIRNNSSGVHLVGSTSLNMTGGDIYDNTSSGYGGGVWLDGYHAAFTMNGGEIYNNTANYGGGVAVFGESTFTMGGGKIYDNNAVFGGDAGGVYVLAGGTFYMNNGKIYNNTAQSQGGGVVVGDTGTLNMNGGEIYGNSATNYRGVYVAGGTFEMNGGEIHHHTGASSFGGGVYVNNSGTFTLYNGKIHDNSASSGGGVCISSSIFNMYGGEIYDNSVEKNNGGGVYLLNSTSIMEGGIISDNTAGDTTSSGYGGGVCVRYGMFTLTKSGKISGNSAGSHGGGVAVMEDATTFNMEGGEISGNYGPTYGGGGVYLEDKVTFNMTEGKIFENSAGYGGGMDMGAYSTFIMSNGEIYGNTAARWGGGVNVSGGTTFAKTGGTIYGYNAAAPNDPYNNKVADSSGTILSKKGHAAYVSGLSYYKETTVTGSLFYNDSVNGTSGWDW
jgi:hypothetical protein